MAMHFIAVVDVAVRWRYIVFGSSSSPRAHIFYFIILPFTFIPFQLPRLLNQALYSHCYPYYY